MDKISIVAVPTDAGLVSPRRVSFVKTAKHCSTTGRSLEKQVDAGCDGAHQTVADVLGDPLLVGPDFAGWTMLRLFLGGDLLVAEVNLSIGHDVDD